MRILDFILAVTLGIWLAFLYFGGQWLTLKHIARVGRVTVLFMASLVGRIGGLLFCFHLVGQDGRWDRLLACVGGFFLMRGVLVRLFDLKSLQYNIMNKGTYGRGPRV